jgi:hypothetical protein
MASCPASRYVPPQQRQREDVEAHFVAEHRIGGAERHGVLPAEHLLPRRPGVEGQQHRGRQRQPGAEHLHFVAGRQRQREAFGRGDLLRLHRQRAGRQPQVQREPRRRDHQRQRAEQALRGEDARVGVLLAEFAEPPPVGEQIGGRRQHEHRGHDQGHDDDAQGGSHAGSLQSMRL